MARLRKRIEAQEVDGELDQALVIGLDGEGYTDRRGRHRYVYMAAVDAVGIVHGELENSRGLRASDVWDFLLSLPRKALLVGFSLGYDRSKWFQSLDNPTIYSLLHPDLRLGEWHSEDKSGETKTFTAPTSVYADGYRLNLVATRFQVTEGRGLAKARGRAKGKGLSRRVWDVFRFFQSSFVSALEAWRVTTKKKIREIETMKRRRGQFSRIGKRERDYCKEECRLLARMTESLLEAHEDAGIPLKNLYGPGTAASSLLERMSADEQNQAFPSEMMGAVQSAFFGGRFEQSWVGPIEGPVYGYDISSAYPFAMTEIPCMCRQGRWRHYKRDVFARLYEARAAIVRYRTREGGGGSIQIDGYHEINQIPWSPLPYRTSEGNIIYPMSSGGGWAHKNEFLEAYANPANRVEILSAWIFESRCRHAPPYKAIVEETYLERLKWGKQTRGKALKLALNSCYGKSAQSIGSPRFRCLVRAGMITAHTRAMIIRDFLPLGWDLLAVNTDGVLTRRRPSSTVDVRRDKRLGSWEAESYPRGVFLIRPGMRFELGPTTLDATAARGLGVRLLHKNRAAVLRAWGRGEKECRIQGPSVFMGAKQSIRTLPDGRVRRDPHYGRWVTPAPELVSFAPEPKRAARSSDNRLLQWVLPEDSSPSERYDRAPIGEEARLAKRWAEIESEQPDLEEEGFDV
jgi:DNA polymerase type B, organellar and viral